MQLFVFANCVGQHVSHTFLDYQSLAGTAKLGGGGADGTYMMNVPALLFVPSSTGLCAVTFDLVFPLFCVAEPLPPLVLDQGIATGAGWGAGHQQSLINYE